MHKIHTMVQAKKSVVDTFTYQLTGNKTVEEAAAAVAAASEKHKFSVMHSYDYFTILQSKGFPIEQKVFVYEICRASMASAMLKQYPELSVFMPCRISIYDQDGHTVVSTMNMELVLKGIESNKALFEEATRMYASIQQLMKDILA